MSGDTIEDGISIPFSEEHQLLDVQGMTSLPGRPLISLDDRARVSGFLGGELSTERLERIYRMLFLVSNRRNISALHHQRVKERQIIVTERADLHLVWYYRHIFIKPVPKCLLSHAFWKSHLTTPLKGQQRQQQSAGSSGSANLAFEARGFLRTYASLIVHESDFEVAKEQRLVPPDTQWEAWCRFIKGFDQLCDAHVAKRYHYGELRLTRLNFWSKLFLRGESYLEVHHNYVTYFARFGTPYLFVFGAITVVLAALQTALQVWPEGPYRVLAASFIPFSIALTAAGIVSFPFLYLMFQLHELWLFIFHYRELS